MIDDSWDADFVVRVAEFMKLENSCNAATLQSFTKERNAIHRFNVVSMECHNVLWNGTLFKREPVAPVDAPDFLKVSPKSFALPIAYNTLHPNSPSRLKQPLDLPILFALKFFVDSSPVGKSLLTVSPRGGMKCSAFVHRVLNCGKGIAGNY